MNGRRGLDAIITVPCGTTVQCLGPPTRALVPVAEVLRASPTLLADLLRDGDEALVAGGGTGGRGNVALRAGRLQSSRLAEDGIPGEQATILLTLKLVADIGLVGFPNAGKSSLLAAISNAEPQIAPYPFTTLHPQLGTVRPPNAPWEETFTVADIPGLVEGAHMNRGLGHAFLSHIERTSLLCYVLDLTCSERHPAQQLAMLQTELERYMPGLASRPCLLVANKADGVAASRRLAELRSQVAHWVNQGELASVLSPATPGASLVLPISALQQRNLGKLASRMAQGLVTCRRLQADADARAAAAAAKSAEDAAASAVELEDGDRSSQQATWDTHGEARIAPQAHKGYGWVREHDAG